MLGAQIELYVIAVGGVAMLVGLGTAIGAADYQEERCKPHDPQEYRYLPHACEDTIGAEAMHRTNFGEFLFHALG